MPEKFNVSTECYALGNLACYAAVDIDDLYLRREKDFSYIDKLAKLLGEVVKEERIAPSTTIVLFNVLKRVKKGRDVREVKDFIAETSDIARDLSSVRDLPRRKLVELRQYCIALSKELLSYEQTYIRHRERLAA